VNDLNLILEDCAGRAGLGAAPRTDQGHRANGNIVWKSSHAGSMTQFRPKGESPTGHTVNAPDSTNCFKPLLTLTLIFPLKVKMPFSDPLAYVLLRFLRTRFSIAVTRPITPSTFRSGALFHNASTWARPALPQVRLWPSKNLPHRTGIRVGVPFPRIKGKGESHLRVARSGVGRFVPGSMPEQTSLRNAVASQGWLHRLVLHAGSEVRRSQ